MIYAMYTGCGIQLYVVEDRAQLITALQAVKPERFERVA